MAANSDADQEYVARVNKMRWKDLSTLWGQIKAGEAVGWEEGKALEHLVVRAFLLKGTKAAVAPTPEVDEAFDWVDAKQQKVRVGLKNGKVVFVETNSKS